ncbi:MAG: DNA polymerase/3'-5' exonuclease PolX [Phycisphaerales bacterium]
MSQTNRELAKLFRNMAAMLEITGANRFRIISYENAARVLNDLADDVTERADDIKALTAIEGIGDGIAKKIIEFAKDGRITDYEKLAATVPAGLLDVLAIQGVGPKTVKLMWEQAGVTDLDSLRAAMDRGDIEALPRLGKKAVANIRDSIAFLEKSSERIRLGKAAPIAEQIVAYLKNVPEITRVEYAGSLRRGCETIGDIDILVASDHAHLVRDAFTQQPGVDKVLASGGTKASIRLEAGMQVDLRVLEEASFGAALLYFTGSKLHNVALRERAIKRGMRLNEYGLFEWDRKSDDETELNGESASTPQQQGQVPIASVTEEDIYAALQLPWIPPELRENRGELNSAMPALIDISDICCELHAHTRASDGRLTIDELALEAKRRGFHTIAVTDHSKSSVQANGLSEEALREHVANVRKANQRIKGIAILAGAEVDILTDGRLDYDDELLSELDIVIASPHAALAQDQKKATARLLRAIEHPLVHIIGHPTARVIGKRDGLPLDISTIVAAAAEHDVALEINASSWRLDLRDTHVRAVMDADGLVAVNTDAHAVSDFDQLRYGVVTARRGWVTTKRCVNTWTAPKLQKWLRRKRG